MPPLTIIAGVVGAVLFLGGLIGRIAGRMPSVSVGAMGAGILLLVVALIFGAAGGSDTESPQDAGATIKVSSTATAAAKGDLEAESAADQADLPVLESVSRPENFDELEVFYEAGTSVANFDAFRLMDIAAYGPAGHGIEAGEKPFEVGQTIYVEFTIQNLRVPPIKLGRTFAGAVHSSEEQLEFGLEHEGSEVVRYQQFKTGVEISLDVAGEWEIWPCYELAGDDDTLRLRCTEKWQFFSIEVVDPSG